jgi:hypothetical protein
MTSERELRPIEVLPQLHSGQRTVASAATVLAVGVRQIHRLMIKYRQDGGAALVHKSRGQASNHRLDLGFFRKISE